MYQLLIYGHILCSLIPITYILRYNIQLYSYQLFFIALYVPTLSTHIQLSFFFLHQNCFFYSILTLYKSGVNVLFIFICCVLNVHCVISHTLTFYFSVSIFQVDLFLNGFKSVRVLFYTRVLIKF